MRVYLDIAKQLEQEVRRCFCPGDYLPPETQLAARYEVNRHTVRRAIDELVFNGLIERQQGRGNMVVSQPYDYPLHAGARFSENLLEQGSSPSSEVLGCTLVGANEKVARILGLKAGAEVIKLTTLRKIDGMPSSLMEHYLACKEWWPVMRRFESGSLHAFLREQFGVQLSRNSTRLRARMPSRTDCRHLKMTSKIPILVFRTTNVIAGTDRVVEYSSSHTRSDMVEVVLEH